MLQHRRMRVVRINPFQILFFHEPMDNDIS